MFIPDNLSRVDGKFLRKSYLMNVLFKFYLDIDLNVAARCPLSYSSGILSV